jgi:hypothetical protein
VSSDAFCTIGRAMAIPWKLLFKSSTIASQAADALVWPDEAGFGSDIVRSLDEAVGDAGYLRQLQVTFTRTSSATLSEDVDVCTFHFAKLSAEDFSNAWVTADYAAVETAFDTWWTALKPNFPAGTKLYQYRWYKSGPANPIAGPALRITTKNVAGTGTGSVVPPQCAESITEVVRIRKHWGRFYLPAMIVGAYDAYGRIAASMFGGAGGVLSNTVTLYNACRTAGVVPVVYSKAKPSRTTKHGTVLPPQPARAYAVDNLQMDDIVDVIRRRRYDTAITKTRTALS